MKRRMTMEERLDNETLAAEREAALSAATHAEFHRNVAEDEALSARIAANQAASAANELETENRILETELSVERDRASSSNMGLILALCIVLGALVVGGFWLWGRMDRGRTIYADTTSGRTVVVQPGVR
jgi:ferric-dicitrate binding protein FerR (iron transport regulator)